MFGTLLDSLGFDNGSPGGEGGNAFRLPVLDFTAVKSGFEVYCD